MQWLAALLSALSSFLDWLKLKSQRRLGELEVENKSLRTEIDTLAKAQEAREEARIVIGSVPESASLPDDGFRRD